MWLCVPAQNTSTFAAMTRPRSQQVDFENGGFYHLGNRCVRQAFLCGTDYATGKDYSHRKDWIEQRLLFLSTIFAVETFAYAVMDNHYHVVASFHPKASALWAPEEIARRWLRLYPKKNSEETQDFVDSVKSDAACAKKLRSRLSATPWFMKSLNEYIARWANHEDQVKGKFWEGRYFSKAIEPSDEIPACMVYVDLNPLRAGITAHPEQVGQHTSLRRRLEELELLDDDSRIQPPAQKLDGGDHQDFAFEHFGDQSLQLSPLNPLPNPASVCSLANALLKPLIPGDFPQVARSLTTGTSLNVTLADYRQRVAAVAERGAGIPQETSRQVRGRSASSDWLHHWLHLMRKFRRRSSTQSLNHSWLHTPAG